MPRFDQASGTVERMPTDPNTGGEDEHRQPWSGPFWLWEEGTEQESDWGSTSERTWAATRRWSGEENRWSEEREQWDGHWSGEEKYWQTGREYEDKWAELAPTSPALESSDDMEERQK